MNKKRYFAYRSFWPELETMKQFREAVGCEVFTVMIANVANSLGLPYTKYPPVWKWNGIYDLEAFDRQLDDVIRAVPDAKIICLLDLNTPHWWVRYLGAFGVRYDSYYELGKISGSSLWRQDTAAYLRAVLEHAVERYGGRMAAFVLGCGGATEWHDRSRGEASIYRLAAFHAWQAANSRTFTDIPGRLHRDAGRHDVSSDFKDPLSYFNGNDPSGGAYTTVFPRGYGLFRTPADDQAVIDYLRFCNTFNADTVSFFLDVARPIIPAGIELGCFFGYSFSAWTLTAGHLAYERLLQDPNLDFVIAPIANYAIGEGSTSATIHETVTRHGKRMLQEMDQKPYCYNRRLNAFCELPDPNAAKTLTWADDSGGKTLAKTFTFGTGNGWTSEAAVAAGIKRDGAMALIRGDSLWWFDMWGGFYQGERVYAALRRIKAIWDEEAAIEPESAADVLVVVDPDNLYLLNDLNERCGTFLNVPRRLLGQSGFVTDTCSFNDLERLDTGRYRFVVLCHAFALDADKRAVLEAHVLNGNRTVLWMYGPVINAAGQWDEEQVARICGVPYGTPGLASATRDGWKARYVFRAETLTLEALIPALHEAGCHAYVTPPRPVQANARLVCIHTGMAETLTVTLRQHYARVTELFTGRAWRETNTVELRSEGPDAFLLRLETDKENGN